MAIVDLVRAAFDVMMALPGLPLLVAVRLGFRNYISHRAVQGGATGATSHRKSIFAG
jgi:hypothetical protein